MLERLVDIRRFLRKGKNIIVGRTLEKSEYIDGKLADTLTKYVTGNNIKIFGLDNKEKVHIFTTDSYKVIMTDIKFIEEELGLRQKNVFYQKFSGKHTQVHYFDVNYENDIHKLQVIAKIKEYK